MIKVKMSFKGGSLKFLISLLFLFFVGTVSAQSQQIASAASGKPYGFTYDEELNHNLSVCLKKEDAIAILKEGATKGDEAAGALFVSNDSCVNVHVFGPKVGKVVFFTNIVKDKKTINKYVIEIIHPDTGEVVAYFFSSLPVGNKIERLT